MGNDSNEGKGQNENEDIELANNANKNQEHESLFQRIQTHIAHSTNFTSIQLETFVDDRNQVSQLQTAIKQEMKLLETDQVHKFPHMGKFMHWIPQVFIPHLVDSLPVYIAPYIYIPGLPLQCTLPFF